MVAGFNNDVGVFIPNEALLVGGDDVVSRGVTLLAGQNLKRGALLGRITASGKYILSEAGAADGSEVPSVILAEDTDATAADRSTVAYFGGTFRERGLTYGTGHTAASVRETLRDVGIKLQPSIAG